MGIHFGSLDYFGVTTSKWDEITPVTGWLYITSMG
jgi:hypothetical protein